MHRSATPLQHVALRSCVLPAGNEGGEGGRVGAEGHSSTGGEEGGEQASGLKGRPALVKGRGHAMGWQG